MVWGHAPNTVFTQQSTIKSMAPLAVLDFNSGVVFPEGGDEAAWHQIWPTVWLLLDEEGPDSSQAQYIPSWGVHQEQTMQTKGGGESSRWGTHSERGDSLIFLYSGVFLSHSMQWNKSCEIKTIHLCLQLTLVVDLSVIKSNALKSSQLIWLVCTKITCLPLFKSAPLSKAEKFFASWVLNFNKVTILLLLLSMATAQLSTRY